MKKYQSKIGIELVVFIGLVMGITGTMMIINHAWAGLIIHFLLISFVVYLFSSTYYVVSCLSPL